jgi:hypothetical protein
MQLAKTSNKIFSSTPVVPTRTSGVFEPVLTGQLQDADTSADTSLLLEEQQGQRLLRFLRLVGISMLEKEDNFRPGPFPRSQVNAFMESLFKGLPDNQEHQRLLSWVEIRDTSMESLKEPRPRKFLFVLHRNLVIRKAAMFAEKGIKFQYSQRQISRLEFAHHFQGRGACSVLDFRCDFASFQQNPTSKYSLGRELSSDKDDQLVFLLNFMLFPLAELARVTLGKVRPHHNSEYDKHGQVREIMLAENPVKVLPATKVQSIFRQEDVELNSRLDCPYLKSLRIDSLAFSFQPMFSKSAINAVLDIKPGDLTKTEFDAKANELIARVVTMQSAIFRSRTYYEDSSTAGFNHLKVEETWKGVSNLWKDEPEEVLTAIGNSSEAQKIRKVSLRTLRPVQGHSLYSISFSTFDARSIEKQFRKYGEYEYTRRQAEKSGRGSLPSGTDLAETLNQSIEITVGVHGRVLHNNYRILTLRDLRDKILNDYDGHVEHLSRDIIQRALTESGVYYWNIPRRWAALAFGSKKSFRKVLEKFTSRKKLKGHFEELSDERWDFLSSLPDLLPMEDESTRASLEVMFQLEKRYVGKHKAKMKAIRSVPELAIALLVQWYLNPNRALWDLIMEADFVPDEYKEVLATPLRNKDPRRAAAYLLIKEVVVFLKANFGVDINYCRDLHVEVARKSAEALALRRDNAAKKTKRRENVTYGQIFDVPLLTEFTYSSFFFRGLRAGAVFPPVSTKE